MLHGPARPLGGPGGDPADVRAQVPRGAGEVFPVWMRARGLRPPSTAVGRDEARWCGRRGRALRCHRRSRRHCRAGTNPVRGGTTRHVLRRGHSLPPRGIEASGGTCHDPLPCPAALAYNTTVPPGMPRRLRRHPPISPPASYTHRMPASRYGCPSRPVRRESVQRHRGPREDRSPASSS